MRQNKEKDKFGKASEVPNVNTAIQHLQELADRMRKPEFGFKEADINSINHIKNSIQELEDERIRVHDNLETETIQASVLRHKLQFLPGEVDKELATAVDSARNSNIEELKSLQNRLKELNAEIETQEGCERELSKENAVLHPERDMVRRQHEEVIAQLNQRMADKAGKQIALNETRDKLRDLNQKIVDLETGIVILKEDMIQERADARQEKKRLKQAVHETTKKIKRQKEANIAKKKEADVLQEEVMESENILMEIRRSIKRYDSSRVRSESQRKTLMEQLDKENKENEILKTKGLDLSSVLATLEARYAVVKDGMDKNLQELDVEISQVNDKIGKLEGNWTDMKLAIKEAEDIRAKDASKVKELDDVLQERKKELTDKAEETARMKMENDELERQMSQLEENHQVTVTLLEKKIADLQLALTKERKERFDLQEQRDNIGHEMETFRQAFNSYMSKMNDRITTAKQEHAQLTAEGLQLEKDIEADDKRIKELQSEKRKAQRKFDKMKKNLGAGISKLEKEIAELEDLVAKKQAEIDAKLPDFEELEKLFKKTTEEFERKKKSIVELKNQRSTLEDNSVRVKREISRMQTPKVAMRHELKKQRTKAISRMKEQSKELASLEEAIYHAGRKLKAVMEENDKFDKAIQKLQEDCESNRQSTVINKILQENLTGDLQRQRERLEIGWDEDKNLQDEYAKRDQVFLDDITELCRRTDDREHRVADITEKLHKELVLLAGFLENVASRRPLDTRQGDRDSPTPDQRPPTVLRKYLDSRTQIMTRSDNKEAPTLNPEQEMT